MADVAGSTSQLIKAAVDMPNKTFIVATDKGIFYNMQQLAPEKNFIAPTGQMARHVEVAPTSLDGYEWLTSN